jgi:hypothetical protein
MTRCAGRRSQVWVGVAGNGNASRRMNCRRHSDLRIYVHGRRLDCEAGRVVSAADPHRASDSPPAVAKHTRDHGIGSRRAVEGVVEANPTRTLVAWRGMAWQESCRHHQAGVLYGGLLTLDWPCLSNEARRFRGLIHGHAALGDAGVHGGA